MSLQSQIQNITLEFTKQVDAYVEAKIKSILDTYYPFEDVKEMTLFQLREFMNSNNLVAEIDTNYETVKEGLAGLTVSWNLETRVKVYRVAREELK